MARWKAGRRGAPSGPPPRRALAPKRSACAVNERGDVRMERVSAAAIGSSLGGYAGFAAWTGNEWEMNATCVVVSTTDVPRSERPSRQNRLNPVGFPGPVVNGCDQPRACCSRCRRGAARRGASRPVGVLCSRVSCFAPRRAFELRRTTRARGGRAAIERARYRARAAIRSAHSEPRERGDRRLRHDLVPRHDPRAPRASCVKGKPNTTC